MLVAVSARDLREVAATDPAGAVEDVVRVPSATETSDAIETAHRALAEIPPARPDQQDADQHRAEELTRWHAHDQAAEHEVVHGTAMERGADASEEPAR